MSPRHARAPFAARRRPAGPYAGPPADPGAGPDAHVVVDLTGELDLAAVPVLRDFVDDQLPTDVAWVTLDLSRLDFMDCTGADQLEWVSRRLAAHGAGLTVTVLEPSIPATVVRMVGLGALVRVTFIPRGGFEAPPAGHP